MWYVDESIHHSAVKAIYAETERDDAYVDSIAFWSMITLVSIPSLIVLCEALIVDLGITHWVLGLVGAV